MGTSSADLARRLASLVDADRLRRDIEVLAAGPRNRRWAAHAMEKAEDYVLAELAAAGWRVECQPFTAALRVASNDRQTGWARLLRLRPYRELSGVNLIARHPLAARGPEVVIGAHLDTVRFSPGADDNASGVAALLEIARILPLLPQLPAVVLAVLDLEELGLIGASAAARRLVADGPIAGMIGLESVGCYRDEPGSQRLPIGARRVFPTAAREIIGTPGDFTLVVHRRTSSAAAAQWWAAAEAVGHRGVLMRDPRRDGLVGSLSTAVLPYTMHLSRSDHAAFWRRGVPALMLTDTASFRNPHYHRTGDLPDTLDYVRLAGVVAATAATAVIPGLWAAPATLL